MGGNYSDPYANDRALQPSSRIEIGDMCPAACGLSPDHPASIRSQPVAVRPRVPAALSAIDLSDRTPGRIADAEGREPGSCPTVHSLHDVSPSDGRQPAALALTENTPHDKEAHYAASTASGKNAVSSRDLVANSKQARISSQVSPSYSSSMSASVAPCARRLRMYSTVKRVPLMTALPPTRHVTWRD